MKVIKLNNQEFFPLTVDNTNITVDTTDITVDQTFIDGEGSYKITLLPRIFYNTSRLELINELTKEQFDLPTMNILNNGYTDVYFTLTNVKDKDSFSATLYSTTNELLWRGKIFATNQENLQEYKMTVPTVSNKIIM